MKVPYRYYIHRSINCVLNIYNLLQAKLPAYDFAQGLSNYCKITLVKNIREQMETFTIAHGQELPKAFHKDLFTLVPLLFKFWLTTFFFFL